MSQRSPVLDLTRGLDRRKSKLSRDPSLFYDILNLLPRSPMGVSTIRKEELLRASGNAQDMLAVTKPNGDLALLARFVSEYGDALGNTFPTIDHDPTALVHSLAPYRGKIIVAQQGSRLQCVDLSAESGSEVKELAESPKGGVAAEFGGCVWCGGETEDDDSAPAVEIPVTGIVIPPVSPSAVTSGTADIVKYAEQGTAEITSSTGNFTGCTGLYIVLDGESYKIKSIKTVSSSNDTAVVDLISGYPTTETNQYYQVFSEGLLLCLPETPDLGTAYLRNDTGKISQRIFNTSSAPIRITGVKPQAAQIRVEDLTTLPYSIPAGGSFTFGIVMTPESLGENTGTVVVEHDYYGQGSINVVASCIGTEREVLASPSAASFGGWPAGESSPEVTIEIKNPLNYSVWLDTSGWVNDLGTNFTLVDALPTEDTEIKPNESYKITLKFTPQVGQTGCLTGSLTFKRYTKAMPFRLWHSRPGYEDRWNRDREWVDLGTDRLVSSEIRAIVEYGNYLIVHMDASVWAITPGGYDGGFIPIHLDQGEGRGALSPQAIRAGNGCLWWASKSAAFGMRGMNIKPISGAIEDVFRSLTDYSDVVAGFYDDYFMITLDDSTWAFCTKEDEEFGGTWWRLDYFPTAMEIDKGAKRKEQLYATYDGNLYILDCLEEAGVSYSLTTAHLGSEIETVKRLVKATLQTTDPEGITRLLAKFSNGGSSVGKVQDQPEGAMFAGVGYYDADTHTITVDSTGRTTNELAGETGTVAGVEVTVASNTDTSIVLTGAISGITTSRFVSVLIHAPTSVDELIRQNTYYFDDGAYGGHFWLEITGSTTGSDPAKIAALIPSYEDVAVDQAGT